MAALRAWASAAVGYASLASWDRNPGRRCRAGLPGSLPVTPGAEMVGARHLMQGPGGVRPFQRHRGASGDTDMDTETETHS